jgi:hypothetical protein
MAQGLRTIYTRQPTPLPLIPTKLRTLETRRKHIHPIINNIQIIDHSILNVDTDTPEQEPRNQPTQQLTDFFETLAGMNNVDSDGDNENQNIGDEKEETHTTRITTTNPTPSDK